MQYNTTVHILIEYHQVYHYEEVGVGGVKGQFANQ